MMMIFLIFLVFVSTLATLAQAGLTSTTLAVEYPIYNIEPRRSHEYNNDDDNYQDDDSDDNDIHNNSSEYIDDDDDGEWHSNKKWNHAPTKVTWQSSLSTSYTTQTDYWSSTTTTVQSSLTSANLALPTVVPSTPLAAPSAQASFSAQKGAMITSQAIKARQRALDASKIISETWLSPQPGYAFASGNEIKLQWTTQTAAASPFQLRLCVLKSTTDLDLAQSGSFSDGACGVPVEAESSLSSSGQGWQISFEAPTVPAADSFFIVISPSQAAASITTPSVDQQNLQQRDLPPISQLISPAFVLAPLGINLDTLNNLSSSLSPSASPTLQPQQLQQQSSPKARPIAWAWIVGPVVVVLCLLVICALIYSHRKGRRSARKVALQETRQGEEKWREETRKEVDELAESTIKQAARWSYIAPPPRCPSPMIHFLPRIDQSSYEDPYTHLPSTLSNVARRLQCNSTIYSSASTPSQSGRPTSRRTDDEGPYAHLPSNLGQVTQRPQRSSTIYSCSSAASTQSSPPLCSLSIRQVAPYDHQGRCKSWTSIVDADRQNSTNYPLSNSQTTLISSPIPAALLPRSDTNMIMLNPHEVNRRPASYPSMSSISHSLQQPPRSRCLSFSAAEASETTGKRGTAHDFVNHTTIKRADHVNNLYLELKQALQQSSFENELLQ